MDQIGNDPTVFNEAILDESQQFEASLNTFDIAVADDFNAAAGMLSLNNVQAVFLGDTDTRFTSFANVAGYYVQVYIRSRRPPITKRPAEERFKHQRPDVSLYDAGYSGGCESGWSERLSNESRWWFRFPGNQRALRLDAAYRINAVPEPSTWAALLLGGVLLLIVARRRATQS